LRVSVGQRQKTKDRKQSPADQVTAHVECLVVVIGRAGQRTPPCGERQAINKGVG
jgi:hypothetical protein